MYCVSNNSTSIWHLTLSVELLSLSSKPLYKYLKNMFFINNILQIIPNTEVSSDNRIQTYWPIS